MPSGARADDTRTRVLDAALALYARAGQEGFTIHAVVAESGVSLGSIYHHFGNMDGLSAAVYARAMASLLEQLGDALRGVRSLARGVEAIVVGYLEFARRERAKMQFIHASAYASFMPSHAPALAADKAPRIAPIVAFFAKHMEAGRVTAMELALLEVLVIGPVAELTRRWLADPSLDLSRAQRVLPARILAAIST